MTPQHDILCIGSVLWDVIGRCTDPMKQGHDKPGRITRLPGGVALNIGMALSRFGVRPALLSAVGMDVEGDALIRACQDRNLVTDMIYRDATLPTDQYMAIEGANGLIAAIADAHSLEAAGDKILMALTNGTLPAPYTGTIALDGNLTETLLHDIATGTLFAQADLRVAPASPGKALRLLPFISSGRGTLYINLIEAGLLCDTNFTSSAEAAHAMLAAGASRVVITDGANPATYADSTVQISETPRAVAAKRITGAGDTFMAAHIAAELQDQSPQEALLSALEAAALYVSGKTTI